MQQPADAEQIDRSPVEPEIITEKNHQATDGDRVHKRCFVFRFQAGDADENRRVRLHSIGNLARRRSHALQRDTAAGFSGGKGFGNGIGSRAYGMGNGSHGFRAIAQWR
ncbi:hypothetical protein D3C72_1302770 [compost metagenome]